MSKNTNYITICLRMLTPCFGPRYFVIKKTFSYPIVLSVTKSCMFSFFVSYCLIKHVFIKFNLDKTTC